MTIEYLSVQLLSMLQELGAKSAHDSACTDHHSHIHTHIHTHTQTDTQTHTPQSCQRSYIVTVVTTRVRQPHKYTTYSSYKLSQQFLRTSALMQLSLNTYTRTHTCTNTPAYIHHLIMNTYSLFPHTHTCTHTLVHSILRPPPPHAHTHTTHVLV